MLIEKQKKGKINIKTEERKVISMPQIIIYMHYIIYYRNIINNRDITCHCTIQMPNRK